jgi:cellulose synthase operon protein C
MSLPSPVPPPQVVARARIDALLADLRREPDARLRAVLAYEVGAQIELRLSEPAQALDHYRYASELDPSFRPALFALRRHLEDARDPESLVRVLAQIVNASTRPAERAAALIDLGCLLEDQLADPAGAKSAFERALAADPNRLDAMLMLERSLLAQHHLAEAQALIARRASLTTDARLRSALACEIAGEQAARSDIDDAVETLLSALALPGRHLSTLFALAQLSKRSARPAIAARACEDLGALIASFAAGNTGPEPRELAARYPAASHASQAAAFYYREAGRLYGQVEGHAGEAVLAYERAWACMHGDLLLGLERVAACEAAEAWSGARTALLELAAQAEPRRAAGLQFQLAELAERQGEADEALACLRSALALAPDSAVVAAALEDRLLDRGEHAALCDLLVERARRLHGADRSCALLRAAMLADRAQQGTRALALYDQVSRLMTDPAPVLRELYGAALRFAEPTALRDAGARLLACDIDHAERSAVLRGCYEAALSQRDLLGARELLRRAIDEPACESWASHSAWVVAALHDDRALLSLAHEKLAELAERAEDAELAAAHLAAQSRALVRLADHARAVTQLRRALELLPTHTYAVALLEECLIARGETAEVVHLLRESASADRDAQRREAALLHAGAAAEAAGRLDLARSSYDEAAERDPLAFAALWARLRFAERSGDRALRLAALRALAARETTLERPGNAQLELAEALIAQDDSAAAVEPLTAALSNESSAFEAAAAAALLPRSAAAEGLRPRALSLLAEYSSRQTRRAFEHERSAELLHVQPDDARTLLSTQAGAAEEPASALLAFLLCDDAKARADAIERLSLLSDDPAERAEFVLHTSRMRAGQQPASDDDALMSALGLLEAAPSSLAAALALDEALSAADDPETRVTGLRGLLEHTPLAAADSVRSALARALLDAERPEQASALAMQLLADRPEDVASWETLRVAARQCQDWSSLVQACDKLAEHCSGVTRARLLEEAAQVSHERLAQLEGAELRLRAALAAAPEQKTAFERLHDVLVERQDLDGLVALLAERIASSNSTPERIDLMYERARILRGRGERDAALSCIRELLAMAPEHAGALGLCAEIHASREDFAAAVDALRALASAAIPPGQQRLAREGAADFLDDKLRNPHAAYLELRPLVQAGLADLTVHVRMADLAQRAGLASQAADALMHAAEGSRGAQRASFERRAASLQLEVLAQPAQAAEALRRALLAQPTDSEAFEALYALAGSQEERLGLRARFLEQLWAALAREPADAPQLRALLRCGRILREPLLEYVSLNALEALGLASRDELLALATLSERMPSAPRAALDDASFALLVPRQLTAVLERFARAGCSAALHVHEDTPERHGVDRRARVAKRAESSQRDALRSWLSAFGLALSDLYVSQSEPRLLCPIAAAGRTHAWVVGREIEVPLARETRFFWGQLAAAARSGLLPLLSSSPAQARELLQVALAAVSGTPLVNAAPQPSELRGLFERKLSRALRRELEEAARALPEASLAPALAVEAARTLALRAGLCACADLGSALTALLGKQRELATVLESKAALDLLRFWLSERCVSALQALGVFA